MSAYLFNGMDSWYMRHKAELFAGKGFTGGHKKKRYSPSPYNTKKATVFNIKRGATVHYGDEHDKNAKLVEEFNKGGYTQHLWNDGNITCNCKGWIYKRHSYRECKHCIEIESELAPTRNKTKETATKSPKPKTLDQEIEAICKEAERVLKQYK